MLSKPLNRSLHAAKVAKQDEFYTQYVDIPKEVEAYLEFDLLASFASSPRAAFAGEKTYPKLLERLGRGAPLYGGARVARRTLGMGQRHREGSAPGTRCGPDR